MPRPVTSPPRTSPATRRRPGGGTCLLTTAVLLALAGCGADDDVASGTIEVHAVDYGYEGLPERIAAGSTISLVNDSASELHELVAVRLPDDEERSVEELLALPMEELEPFFPLVSDVIVALPGETDAPGAVEGDGVLEEPGRYAVFCFIPVGADPQAYMEAAGEDGPPPSSGAPHFTQGMHAEVEVVG